MSETTIDCGLYDEVANYLQELQGIADLLLLAADNDAAEISNDTLLGVASSLYFRTSAVRKAWAASQQETSS